jgi:S1-C subfamily serine protease
MPLKVEKADERVRRDQTLKGDPIRRSVMRVSISPVRTDPVRPWIRRPSEAYTMVGLYLGDGLILIQADDVRNAVLIEVSRADSYSREKAKVVLIDMETNLAILQIENLSFVNDLVPLEFGSDPVQGDEIVAVRTDALFRIYREAVRVIEYSITSDYGFTRLPVFVFSAQESYQGGDILLKGGKLAGFVAFQGQQGKGVAVPVSRLDAFRNRALSSMKNGSPYQGFVVQGVELEELADPQLRSYLGLDGRGLLAGGAYVGSVLPETPAASVLKSGDVLLVLDGQPVDERGLYRDPLLGLQRAELLLTRDVRGRYRNPGDRIKMTILRDRKKQDVELTLHEYRGTAERIPWLLPDDRPPYLVESGLVFLELSVPYLQNRFGKDWRRRALELAYIYDVKKNYAAGDEKDRILILSEVLPDPVNQGYQGYGVEVIESVNGQKVRDLKELIDRINGARQIPDAVIEIIFTSGSRVYLDPAAKEDNERIRRTYRLPALYRYR